MTPRVFSMSRPWNTAASSQRPYRTYILRALAKMDHDLSGPLAVKGCSRPPLQSKILLGGSALTIGFLGHRAMIKYNSTDSAPPTRPFGLSRTNILVGSSTLLGGAMIYTTHLSLTSARRCPQIGWASLTVLSLFAVCRAIGMVKRIKQE